MDPNRQGREYHCRLNVIVSGHGSSGSPDHHEFRTASSTMDQRAANQPLITDDCLTSPGVTP